MDSQIIIIDSHALSRSRIEEALQRHKIEGCGVRDGISEPSRAAGSIYIWIGNKNEPIPEYLTVNQNCFFRPVRVGAVLERVKKLILLSKNQNNAPQFLIGGYVLNSADNELSADGRPVIRLTDKEKEILMLLAEAQGMTIGRDVLLKKVWAYAPNLETHTLETHIYRLRQKIEKDPAKPEILLTDGAGYKLSSL